MTRCPRSCRSIVRRLSQSSGRYAAVEARCEYCDGGATRERARNVVRWSDDVVESAHARSAACGQILRSCIHEREPCGNWKVGVVGAGRMGQPIIGHMVRKGWRWQRMTSSRPDASRSWRWAPTWADTPDALAGAAEAILISVGYDQPVAGVDGGRPSERRAARDDCRRALHRPSAYVCRSWRSGPSSWYCSGRFHALPGRAGG
jgi:hypothetical protein